MSVEVLQTSPGREHEPLPGTLEAIVADMTRLGEVALMQPVPENKPLMSSREVPGIGILLWSNWPDGLHVRATQVIDGAEEESLVLGKEADCSFTVEDGELYPRMALKQGDRFFTLTNSPQDGKVDHYTVRQEGGQLVARSDEGSILTPDEIADYAALTQDMAARGMSLL